VSYRERCSEDGRWVEEDFSCAVHLGPSAEHSVICAVKADGRVHCWGQEYFATQVLALIAGAPWVEIHLADELSANPSVCAVDAQRSASCWTTPSGGLPRRFAGPLRSLALGAYGYCTLSAEGSLFCPYPEALTSTVFDDPGPFVSIELNNDGLYALGEDGTLHAPPYMMFPAGRYLDSSANGNGACAVREDGTLVCLPWGVPDEVAAERFVDVEVNYSNGVCARRRDDTVLCWAASEQAPLPEPPGGRFKSLASSNSAFCGVRDDGSVGCWGDPYFETPDGW
jgi:hypothetical protein